MKARLTLCLLALLLPAAAAGAEERILDFHSDITIRTDGALIVTETIRVRAEGEKIKHGIYRDFPVRYSGGWLGAGRRVGFDVIEVTRDGRPEGYRVTGITSSDTLSKIANYKRVYIGDSDVLLPPGETTYRLTYRTDRQLGFFDDHDELYWNVTGNDWDFPIDNVSATVRLPANILAGSWRLKAYTGPVGARGTAWESRLDEDGNPFFQTTAPLGLHEGITIVAGFPKGIVAEPTRGQKVRYWLRDNLPVGVAVVGLVIVAVYFTLVWLRVGVDPPKGIIIPLFSPPGVSPAAARFIRRMGYDKACFAAGLVGMAVKGVFTIRETDGEYSLRKRGDADDKALFDDERAIRETLLTTDTVALKQENHTRIATAITDQKKALVDAFRGPGRMFVSNLRHFVVGAVLAGLTLVGVTLAAGNPVILFLLVWLTIWTVGVLGLLRGVFTAWRGVFFGTGDVLKKTGSAGGALVITLFALPFLAGEVFVGYLLLTMLSLQVIPIVLLLALLCFKALHWLKKPSVEGRKLMDRIEGFRMYLATAEQDLLNTATPPEKTPELFERCLPYAMALDVENAWAEKFSGVLARAAEKGYEPTWYHGTLAGVGAIGVASALGGSLTSAVSTASRSPSRGGGSGFSGGGSSGGGGGGGGGGGW